jgi:hypothetical protein
VPAAAIPGRELFLSAFAQAKPNSLNDGVQIGTIIAIAACRSECRSHAEHRRLGHQRGGADGRANDWARMKGNSAEQRRRRARPGGGGGAGGGRARAEAAAGGSGSRDAHCQWLAKCAPGREGNAACRWRRLLAPAAQAQPRRLRAQRLRVEAVEDVAAVSRRRQVHRGGRGTQVALALPMSIFKDLRKIYRRRREHLRREGCAPGH